MDQEATKHKYKVQTHPVGEVHTGKKERKIDKMKTQNIKRKIT
jgi:hypothetical protein